MRRLTRKRSVRRVFRPEPLEPRALRAGGLSAASEAIQDLGAVSPSAAVRGVEATALIDAGRSVTFRFEAEAAGQYALRVRYTGEGLALKARGPSGLSTIEPGPPGPFATVILPIQEATYQIQAIALGDEPVFVDWELLLISGAGQAPAISTTLVAPATSIPLPGPATPAGVVPVPSTPTPTPLPTFSPISTSSMIALGGPIGRPELARPIAPVGPTTPGGSLAMAYAGEGLPPGLSPVDSPMEPGEQSPPSIASSPVTLDAPGDVALDEAALAIDSWWDRLALAMVPAGSNDGPDEDEASESAEPAGFNPPTSRDERHEVTSVGPGMTAGLVAAVIIARRGRRNLGPKVKTKPSTSAMARAEWPRSFG